MIDAYAWTTPNGYKLLIALEELGLPYVLKWIDLTKGQQKAPEYLAINPNNKIPAIVDHQGPGGAPITVFESGAVLLYLADKAGKLIAPGGPRRYTALEWMFFNTGSAPMIGQLGYYTLFAPEKDAKAIERFTSEVQRLLGVLDRRLGESRFVIGDEFSIADVMNFTWPRMAVTRLGIDGNAFPHLKRWLDEIEARPAVQRALAMQPA
jgi:GST-like protein